MKGISMEEEIRELREEISRLRERIAVLEAQKQYQPQPFTQPYWTWPQWYGSRTGDPIFPPGTIIC